ncbi:MAG TPA: PLP-dependent cysteine synthase family protein [Nitriliruptoraceae bacterium]|nr:PLP-dependent cysteine synthase family protein [Nitriliruptoraceae bacterium]
MDRHGALAAIGSTPLVRLQRLVDADMAQVWVKMEAANPTGSYKDRMALAMIEGAQARGDLAPGQAVVEYTGGSTGSSLAFVCAVKGIPLHIVTSDAFAAEKLATIAAFGAQLDVLPSPEGITPTLIPAMMDRAAEIAEAEGAFATDQLHNTDMLDGYRELGVEVSSQLEGSVDAFCSYVGTAGCFLGATRALREHHPAMQRVGIEPAESAVLSGGQPGTHRIEGGGIGIVPPLLSPDDLDRVEVVTTDDAFAMARRAARREGIFSGPSTGANLVVALRLAAELGPGHQVVTVQCDSGLKYLAGGLHG